MSEAYEKISNQENQDAIDLIKKLKVSLNQTLTEMKETPEPTTFFELYGVYRSDEADFLALEKDYEPERANHLGEDVKVVEAFLNHFFEIALEKVQSTKDKAEKLTYAETFKTEFFPYINQLKNENVVHLAGMYEALTLL